MESQASQHIDTNEPRILVVDGSKVARLMITQVLKQDLPDCRVVACARGEEARDQLQAGAVNMNNVLSNLFQLTLPMGGWKESGIGTRLGGSNAVLKFCRPQAQISERVAMKSEVYWFPISKRKAVMQARAMRMMAAGDWRRRLGLRGR